MGTMYGWLSLAHARRAIVALLNRARQSGAVISWMSMAKPRAGSPCRTDVRHLWLDRRAVETERKVDGIVRLPTCAVPIGTASVVRAVCAVMNGRRGVDRPCLSSRDHQSGPEDHSQRGWI